MNKKSPRRIRPSHCSPSPRGAKAITVTQDTSPCGVAEVCDEYFFGRVKYLFGRTKTGRRRRKRQKKKMGSYRSLLGFFFKCNRCVKNRVI